MIFICQLKEKNKARKRDGRKEKREGKRNYWVQFFLNLNIFINT